MMLRMTRLGSLGGVDSTKANALGSSYETRGVGMIPAPEGVNVCDGEIISGGERRGCGY
jgi:hypothetical protein